MIITSNRAPGDWYPLFPNPVVAESLLDRLINASAATGKVHRLATPATALATR
ncbi:hypothetical protein ACH4UM_38240 [Streptomyces sp. NPDC020801]|uniref:hypothetical protein n=1 Tax=unclassified Streptomyces TaxID=2593676 RepID=UPI00379048F6